MAAGQKGPGDLHPPRANVPEVPDDLAEIGITPADLARRQQLRMPTENPPAKDAGGKSFLDPKPGDGKSSDPKAADPKVAGKKGDNLADPTKGLDADAAAPKPPVPNEAAQQKSLQQLKDVMKDDFAQAKSPDDQLALAERLEKLAADTKDDLSARYVTFSQALEIATRFGNVDLALEVVETLGNSYDLDVWDLRQKTLTQLARTARSADGRAAVAKSALDLAQQAVMQSRFEMAASLSMIALNLSAAAKDNLLRDQARELNERTKKLQKELPALEAAKLKLKTAPDDAEANLFVGRFECLLQGDWKAGLPSLVKGSDAALKALAKLELAAPTDAEAQAKLADGWWDQTEKKGVRKEDPFIKAMHARAVYWYQLALPNLSGLTLAKVQKRIDAVEANKPEAPIQETAYLDDLPEQNLTLANSSLGKHGETGYDRGFGGFGRGRHGGGSYNNSPKHVVVRGTEAKHALSLMPKSNGQATVAYKLDGKWREFIGTAAIIDGDNPQGVVKFRVFSDGKLVWESRPMRRCRGISRSANCTCPKPKPCSF